MRPVKSLRYGLAASLFGVSGCNASIIESNEDCVARFDELGAKIMPQRTGLFDPIYTYDISKTENFTESMIAEDVEGYRMTFSIGAPGPALEKFYSAEVPPKGSFFAGEGISLYRVKGKSASLRQTIIAGCQSTPEGARLIYIAWAADHSGHWNSNAQTH